MYAGLVIGPILLLVGLGCLLYTLHFLHTAERTEGKVLELRRNVDSDGDISFAPVFQFVAPNGTKYVVESHLSTSSPSFEPGQTVALRYDPRNPDSARIATYTQTWGYETVCAILSVVFTSIGLGLRSWFRRKPRFSDLAPR